ncbi:MAG: cyclic nucleotide-binding domain-containing protein, partial [Pleurocapsa sp. MO_226.B13]|nr:cyclic nucleotide-binding domain-containing protein [Pleurocapsa sp. MO_226.B13]
MTDIIKALRLGKIFVNLTDEQLHWIAAQGNQIFLKQGDIFVKQGESAGQFYFLLAGELEFTTNEFGNQDVHVINLNPGSFFGPELFLLDIPTFLGTGRAVRNSHLFRLEENVFWDISAKYPSIIREVLRAAARLWQNYEEVLLHHGKLNAIDTLSAGLAHELNNPAASISRSAADFKKTFLTLPSFLLKLHQLPLTQNQLAFIVDLPCNLIAQQKMSARLDPLLQSDREDEVLYWLEKHGILNGWQLAPTLVKAGINTQWLDTVTKEIFPNPPGEILTWLEAMLTGFDLLSGIEQGSARISELVSNVKKYSYVGRDPLQKVDVHEGLESTLTILEHKLKQKPGVIINREYDKNLPRIYAYGSELNQAWTNLIDNAIDAIDEKGNL